MGSEGFSRFPSPHSLVGSDEFVPKSIVPTVSAVFLLDQVLACTESATSEYSNTSQCLSAPLGWPGRAKFILNGLRWEKNQRTYRSYTTTAWRLFLSGRNANLFLLI